MEITRRNLLARSAMVVLGMPQRLPGGVSKVNVSVDERRKLGLIPKDFLGLGYEISSVSTAGLLSPRNASYVNLMRNLGAAGVVRIGGLTADDASFMPDAAAVSKAKGSVVNLANLRELASLLRATGWKLIWCLNLGSGSAEEAATEAVAVDREMGDRLLALEIGNEPDGFHAGSFAHRAPAYGYDDYLQEYRRYKEAIRKKLPSAPFAGPDAASKTDWVTRFAADEGRDLKMLTHHYYRECANPTSTLDKLLHTDPKLAPMLEKLRAATAASGVPFRICETNSFCGGGKPGVSDTFGAALWALDFLWKLVDGGCAGVNMETGVNQLDFVSSYSPIADNSAKPEYYGMLAFAQAVGGERVSVEIDAGDLNLSAYAALQGRAVLVTLINKETAVVVDVQITASARFGSARALRLTAPSLESKEGVTFGGSSVSKQGEWKPHKAEGLAFKDRQCEVHLNPASAVVIALKTE